MANKAINKAVVENAERNGISKEAYFEFEIFNIADM